MNIEQHVSSEVLSLDLAFTSCIPLTVKHHLDEESRSLLTDLNSWRVTLTRWIDFVRQNPQLTCPEPVRKNNSLSLGLVFTNDSVISELNKTWRHNNMPTDVLAFPALEEDFLPPSKVAIELGDIFVSVETACRQARFYDQSLGQELSWLVSHGILHLLGWDHPCSKSRINMLNLQEELIKIKDQILSHTPVKPY